ncbi:MAG: Fe-S cluster assembly protein SufD, partial [Gammaproteobacteria bacterium]|nr:Fe-S cluster assembly protein SufD [Gammaproteobacteria bacterium]
RMSQPAVEHYLEEYARAAATAPDWFSPQRQSALKALRANGFPTLKHEDWKYTDIRPIT